MTNNTLNFRPIGAMSPDGSSGNLPAQFQRTKGSAGPPAPFIGELLFDASQNEGAQWEGWRMPANYGSSLTCKILWKANATTGNVVWNAYLYAVTPGDADTPNEHAFATVNTATTGVNATEARREVETSITMTNADSVAAGDYCILFIERNATSGSDTLAVDAEVLNVALEYTPV